MANSFRDIIDNKLQDREEVRLIIPVGDQYSRSILRNSFYMTTVHSPGVDLAVQVSNVHTPDTTTDDDWFTIGTGEYVNCVPAPFKWLRVKLPTPAGEVITANVLSIRATY